MTKEILQQRYEETVREFICELDEYHEPNTRWFADGEDFLFGAETDDWHDNAVYYQWYLAGMQYAMSILFPTNNNAQTT